MQSGLTWLVAIAALAAVATVALQFSEARDLVAIAEQAQPAWILAALVLQASTYVFEALTWHVVFAPAGLRFEHWHFLGSLARMLCDADRDAALSPRSIVKTGSCQFAFFLLDALTLWVCLAAIGARATIADAFAAYTIASIARMLGVTPGGLGTFEAALVALLATLHVPMAAALAATLLLRGVTFWLPMFPGLMVARREARDHADPTPSQEAPC